MCIRARHLPALPLSFGAFLARRMLTPILQPRAFLAQHPVITLASRDMGLAMPLLMHAPLGPLTAIMIHPRSVLLVSARVYMSQSVVLATVTRPNSLVLREPRIRMETHQLHVRNALLLVSTYLHSLH